VGKPHECGYKNKARISINPTHLVAADSRGRLLGQESHRETPKKRNLLSIVAINFTSV